VDGVTFVGFLDKLNLVKQLFFLVVNAVPGISETLLIEHGITGIILT
jgi:hypothetical protein